MQGMVSLQLNFHKGVMAIIQPRSNDLYANRMSHTGNDNENGKERENKTGKEKDTRKTATLQSP